MWYPVANAHRDPDITKLTPYTHQSFNLAIDLASDLSTIEQLTLPYTLTVTYEESSILAIYEDTLKVYRWDGEKWNDINNQTLDILNNTITVSSAKTGEFLVMGEPIPVSERLTITAGPITFGSHPLTGRTETFTGITDPWLILDATYQDPGWYVTIRGTDFSDSAGHSIPIQNLTIQIPADQIQLLAGDSPPVSQVTSATQLLTTDITVLVSPVGSSTGRFAINPIYKLEVPAQTYGGIYQSDLLITLISGP
jgi:hypothetical protein